MDLRNIVIPVTDSPLYNFNNGRPVRSVSPCPCRSKECMEEYEKELLAIEKFKEKVHEFVQALKK